MLNLGGNHDFPGFQAIKEVISDLDAQKFQNITNFRSNKPKKLNICQNYHEKLAKKGSKSAKMKEKAQYSWFLALKLGLNVLNTQKFKIFKFQIKQLKYL